MNTMPRLVSAPIVLLAISLLLSACAGSRPSPGHHYNEICREVPDNATSNEGSGADAQTVKGSESANKQNDYRASANLESLADGGKAKDIAQARQHLLNVRRAYELFECQEENSNRNNYDRPLLVTAVVAAGAALAKANAYILGGIGLAAGGIATFKAYNHPDTDRDAFLTAYTQLTCVYDETHSLRYNINVDKLMYDRDALQIAIGVVSQQVSPLVADKANQSAQQKAIVAAAAAAITAGNKAVDAIDASLSDYNRISTVLYKTVDSIDITARNANRTNGTYTSFTSSIKDAYAAAGQDKATTDDAKKKVDTADAAEKAAAMVNADAADDKKTQKSAKTTAMHNLIVASARPIEHPKSTAFRSSCKAKAPGCDGVEIDPDSGKATDSSTNSELRASRILSDPTSSDIAKLVRLAAVATETLPSPSYADIIANVIACVPKS